MNTKALLIVLLIACVAACTSVCLVYLVLNAHAAPSRVAVRRLDSDKQESRCVPASTPVESAPSPIRWLQRKLAPHGLFIPPPPVDTAPSPVLVPDAPPGQ